MALGKGVNSYATVAEADAHFEDRLDVAAWSEAAEAEKAKALVTATQYLDGLEWIGTSVSDSQPLAFPRVGVYYDPKLGREVTLTSSVPSRIVTATFELAYHFLNNDGLLDETGSVTNLQISSISLNEVRAPVKFPSFVRTLVKPLLLSGGSKTWWRAN